MKYMELNMEMPRNNKKILKLISGIPGAHFHYPTQSSVITKKGGYYSSSLCKGVKVKICF